MKCPSRCSFTDAAVTEARQKLSTARDRKIQARAVAEERDRANTPSTVSNLSKAQTTVAMLAAEESRFANTYNQVRTVPNVAADI